MSTRIIGTSVPRKEGRGKVTGSARYIDDITFPEMLHGATVRSPVARGRIRGVYFEGGLPWNEFTVATAKDIPAHNCVALITEDQPCLADGIVNHPEEPILLLARAASGIFTLEDSLARKEIVWGEDNIFKSYHVEKGNVDAEWEHADFIVEGEYRTGAQEQLYIEPQGVIAQASANEGKRKGSIAVGYDADLVIWDPDAKFVVDPTALHHRHKITPYAGRELVGVVETTFLRGCKIFDRGEFAPSPFGKVLRRGQA